MDHGNTSIVWDPADPTIFWETGSYGSHGGVYKSSDDGVTVKQLGGITHDDFVSVDFSDPRRRTLLVGGHESQSLQKSTDGGGNVDRHRRFRAQRPAGVYLFADPRFKNFFARLWRQGRLWLISHSEVDRCGQDLA